MIAAVSVINVSLIYVAVEKYLFHIDHFVAKKLNQFCAKNGLIVFPRKWSIWILARHVTVKSQLKACKRFGSGVNRRI